MIGNNHDKCKWWFKVGPFIQKLNFITIKPKAIKPVKHGKQNLAYAFVRNKMLAYDVLLCNSWKIFRNIR